MCKKLKHQAYMTTVISLFGTVVFSHFRVILTEVKNLSNKNKK